MRLVVGMRNIKTAIAISLCVVISHLLNLEYPFYAAIATVISMESSVTSSFVAGKNRMMGTLVGACTGLIFASIRPDNALYCALGAIVVIYVCNLLKWNKSVSIACIVFLAVMLNLKGGNPLLYSMNRIFDTMIGISVAVLVNYLVFPPKHEVNIMKARKALAKKMTNTFEQMVCMEEEADLKSLKAGIAALEKYVNMFMVEFRLKKDVNDTMEQIAEELDSYKHIYAHLKMVQQLGKGHSLSLDNLERLKSLNYHPVESGQQEQGPFHIVYNYHVDRILNDMENLGLFFRNQSSEG